MHSGTTKIANVMTVPAALDLHRAIGATAKEARLREESGIFTVRRGGVAAGDCVRISPALFMTADDIDRPVRALKAIAA